jgi:ubiquinone/menaquinone biosynthesis C-methylase UbiE
MASYVCPWWAAGITINNPVRRLLHDPQKIVGPYVSAGMTVMDVGCGVGWFSVPMATMVGDHGRVIAVDLQQQMLNMLRRRAEKAGVADRIELHKCEQNGLGVHVQADFVLVFAMLHEVPNQRGLLEEILRCLKPGGNLLLAEPPIHVSRKMFADEVAIAKEVGFQMVEQPRLRWCHAVVFTKANEPL